MSSEVTLVRGIEVQAKVRNKRSLVTKLLQQLWNDERGQDIAEYAVMLAVILVIVVGTIRLIGSNANNVFSQVGSAIQ
jgi:Flp pilus assembly pilin Flp